MHNQNQMSKTASSTALRRLQNLFTEPTPSSIKTLSKNLKKQRNLNLLVTKLKAFSPHDLFRKNTPLYLLAIRRLSSAERFQCIEDILETQKKNPNIQKEGFNARLIYLYGVAGMYGHARNVFDEMPQRNFKRTVLSFNALLAACVNSKRFDEVLRLFREVPREVGIEPDLVSYGTVIKAFCEMGCFGSGVSMLFEMSKRGLEANLVVYNTLLDGLYVNKRFMEGERIWSVMLRNGVQPDVMSYTSRLIGLGLAKGADDVACLVAEMVKKGVKFDAIYFDALIRCFVDRKNLEGAKRWYGKIGKCKFRPLKVTYVRLIPLACEKCDMGFAFELAKDVFCNKCNVKEALLQQVVDGLVRESKFEAAEEVVRLGNDNGFCRYRLKLP